MLVRLMMWSKSLSSLLLAFTEGCICFDGALFGLHQFCCRGQNFRQSFSLDGRPGVE